MRYSFRLPEPGSPEIAVDQSQLTGLSVYADGERLPRLRERGIPSWQIPMADGTTRRVSIGGQMRGLEAVIEGDGTMQLERRLAIWELILAVLPFSLLGLTGIAGGVLGLIAILANLRILRLAWPMPARVLATLGTLVVAGIGSYLIDRVLFA